MYDLMAKASILLLKMLGFKKKRAISFGYWFISLVQADYCRERKTKNKKRVLDEKKNNAHSLYWKAALHYSLSAGWDPAQITPQCHTNSAASRR